MARRGTDLDSNCTNKSDDIPVCSICGYKVVLRACRIVMLGFTVCLDERLRSQIDNVLHASEYY